MKNLAAWAAVFVCGWVFTRFVDVGGNFFGLPQTAVDVLFALNLTLFLWLLARFVGRPIAASLEARAAAISQELRTAQQQLVEAEKARAEVGERLARVEHEVTELGERAARESAAEAREIADQTARDEQRFLTRVDDEIARREMEARHNLAQDAARLTAELTRDVLRRELTADDRSRLLDRSLAALRAADKE